MVVTGNSVFLSYDFKHNGNSDTELVVVFEVSESYVYVLFLIQVILAPRFVVSFERVSYSHRQQQQSLRILKLKIG